MNTQRWQWLKQLPAALAAPTREPAEYARLVLTLQRSVILPARAIAVAVVLYYVFNWPWLGEGENEFVVVFQTTQNVLVACALFMAAVAAVFYVVRRFPPGSVQWLLFAMGLADGVFLAGVTVLTRGFESDFYWVFPVLIVVNAVSIPLATPQIVLNLLLCVFFLGAGHIETTTQPELALPGVTPRLSRSKPARLEPEDIQNPRAVAQWLRSAPSPVDQLLSNILSQASRSALETNLQPAITNSSVQSALAEDLNRILLPRTRYLPSQDSGHDGEPVASPYILRVAVLLLLTFCCYGVQVLTARERRIAEEREEFLVRTAQLHSAGRLAAEVAHQIKNPLAIINNVTFSLHKNLKNLKSEAAAQVGIIREEVAKADLIITQIMGYAQLSEGRVEKIEVVEEINRAIAEVFPAGLPTQIKIHRQFDDYFPPVMMHRRHLAEAVGNLLQNARDAMGQHGNIFIIARCLPDYAIEITVQDDGPGIPADRVEKVFEAYYTTKPKGTGLGLAVVKHNVELYGGQVRVESALGRGAKFVLQFPARTLMKPGP
jgi:signal transduction histidine kinase